MFEHIPAVLLLDLRQYTMPVAQKQDLLQLINYCSIYSSSAHENIIAFSPRFL